MIRPLLILLTGSGAAQAITLLLSPVLSRLYSPGDFGVLAVYGSLVAVFGAVASLRLDLAVAVPPEDSRALAVMRTAVWIALVLGLSLVAVSHAFGRQIAELLGQPALRPVLPIVGITVFSYGVFQSLVQWNARISRFRSVATAQLSRSVITNSAQLLGGLAGFGGGGLVLGQFLGQITASLRLLFASGLVRQLASPRIDEARGVLSEYREFTLFGAPQSLVNSVSQNLPNLIFSAMISPAAAGLYAMAHRILAAPARLVGDSLRQALYPRLARSLQDEGIMLLILRMIGMMALLVVLPLGLMAFAGPYLFASLFGPEWFEAGQMARYMVFSVAVGFLNIPSVCIIQLLRLQRLYLVYEVVYVVARVAALVTGAMKGDPLLAVMLYVAVGVLFNLILIMFPLFVLGRRKQTNG